MIRHTNIHTCRTKKRINLKYSFNTRPDLEIAESTQIWAFVADANPVFTFGPL